MDSQLSFVSHVHNLIKSCYFHLRNITKIKSTLSFHDLERLIHAFVFSHLDYCNDLFTCLSQSSVAQLQLVQNAATRILTTSNRKSHITPILASLHWLPVKFRIVFKIPLITFKPQHGLAPTYITELLTPYAPHRDLRSSSLPLLAVPRSRLVTKVDQAFALRAPRLWNSLPKEIRLASTLPVIKSDFYRKAFSFDA